MSTRSLLERLRKSRSTGRTFILERWPEIRDALAAGYPKKDIWAELQKDGLTIGYTQFARFTKELLADENETAQTRPSKKEQPPARPAAAPIQTHESEARPAQPAASSHDADKDVGDRFTHNPRPDEKDLV